MRQRPGIGSQACARAAAQTPAALGRIRLIFHRLGVVLEPVALSPPDVPALLAFLRRADLTLSGLGAPSVRLWLMRDSRGAAYGSTGYELSADGQHALVRSVAVDPSRRRGGLGLQLARFALTRAADDGAGQAWLFSRRSGSFWRRLGFQAADRDNLAQVLASTYQVQLFQSTGQLQQEVASSRPVPIVR